MILKEVWLWKDYFRLEGKKAVVIGGGGGIGQTIAKGLAYYGAQVVITGRKMETLEKAAADIEGGVDILVNSQGYNQKFPIGDMPLEVWDDMLAINVKGVMPTCRSFAKEMIKRGWSWIINITSIRGIRALNGGAGNTAYSTTKEAVDMLTKSLAAEWAKTGVTVSGIGPVITETPMMIPIFKAQPDFKTNLLRNIPMGRTGLPVALFKKISEDECFTNRVNKGENL